MFLFIRRSFCVSDFTSRKTTSPTTQRPPPSGRWWPWSLRGWWRRTRSSKVIWSLLKSSRFTFVPRVHVWLRVAAGLAEEPPAVQGNSNRRSVSTLRPSAKDAYMLFQDLCQLVNADAPYWLVGMTEMTRTFGLELLESVLNDFPQVFLQVNTTLSNTNGAHPPLVPWPPPCFVFYRSTRSSVSCWRNASVRWSSSSSLRTSSFVRAAAAAAARRLRPLWRNPIFPSVWDSCGWSRFSLNTSTASWWDTDEMTREARYIYYVVLADWLSGRSRSVNVGGHMLMSWWFVGDGVRDLLVSAGKVSGWRETPVVESRGCGVCTQTVCSASFTAVREHTKQTRTWTKMFLRLNVCDLQKNWSFIFLRLMFS